MNSLTIFIKDIGFDTGVVVSTQHLSALLEKNNIDFQLAWYKNDEELLEAIGGSKSKYINLQVPSFKDETMDKILKMDKNIILSIHSTMCNLQVEEGALERIINWSSKAKNNFKITCPSLCETQGFNSFSKVEFIYLPNTFSYKLDEENIRKSISRKSENMNPVKIGLFCAYRPFKNMIIQLAAVVKLAKKYPIELHLFEESFENPIFASILKIAEQANLKLVLHKQRSNKEYFELIQGIHIGLQVSLSETFSYVAFEHMISGIPVIGSDSIPFSSIVAKYSNVNSIENAIEEIIQSKNKYQEYALTSAKTARELMANNKQEAIEAIKYMTSQ